MNIINNTSKKLHKSLKGNIDIPNLVKYLESIGYSVVFFNTEDGDELLKSYGINPGITKAFTYCGATKIIFVDGKLHTSDKLYSLLHECGHILLGHIGNNSIELLNKRSIENEAEAFVYAVLNYRGSANKKSRSFIFIAILLVLSLFFAVKINSSYQFKSSTANYGEIVYITPTGTKYHRASCSYVKNSRTAKIEKVEAAKIHEPCNACNP